MQERLYRRATRRIAVYRFLPQAVFLVLLLAAVAPADAGSLAEIERLREQGQFDEAERRLLPLLAEAEAEDGRGSLAVADVLDLLTSVLFERDQTATADLVRLGERAVAIRERLQPNRPRLAHGLSRLSSLYTSSGDPAGGVEVQLRAVAIFEQHPGTDGLDLALAMLQLGRAYYGNGQAREAMDAYETALSTYEAVFGPSHPEVATILQDMVGALPAGNPRRLAIAERAVAIRRVHADDDPDGLAQALSRLAHVMFDSGRVVEAGALMAEVLEITEAMYEPGHYRVAVASRRRGLSLFQLGRLAEARPLFERSVAIFEQRLGRNHVEVAGALSTLGTLYEAIGDYRRAEASWADAIEIFEAQPSPSHVAAVALFNYGNSLLESGKIAESRVYFQRGLDTCENLVGVERWVGTARMERCVRFLRRGLIPEAREQIAKAIPLLASSIGEASVEYASAVGMLGTVLVRSGDLGSGLKNLERADSIIASIPGYRGPKTWFVRSELARAYFQAGRPTEALEAALTAERLAREHFRESTTMFSEREALQYQLQLTSGIDVALSLITSRPAGLDSANVRRVFDEVIQSRALVLDEMISRHPAYYGSMSAELGALHERLAVAKERLARLSVAPPAEHDPATRKNELHDAWNQVERVERELARSSRPFRQRLRRFTHGLTDVQGALPAGSVLVAYRRYVSMPGPPREPNPAEAAPAVERDAYLAFVLRPGTAAPTVVELGSGTEIDAQVERWRQQISNPPPPARRAGLMAEQHYRVEGARLRKLIWGPVARVIGAPDLVLVVPDGALHLVNFATFPDDRAAYLVDELTFHHLGAERDLVPDLEPLGGGRGLIAIGDPDFDAGPVPAQVAKRQPPAERVGGFRGSRSSCTELRQRQYSRLPAARREVVEIAEMWDSRHAAAGRLPENALVLTGRKATEGAVKLLAPGRRVIHLATHGFTAPRGCASVMSPGSRGAQLDEMRSLENPLLQSGLVFAGANRSEMLDTDAGVEDGTLTAQEVAALDLSAAEWVVLSACETGVGHVLSGEGVLGLRRSFQIAGADTLIMSLWEIRDEAAHSWMREAYAGRFAGLTTAEAVRKASLSALKRRRDDQWTTHPFYWGAFIAAGDWR